MDVDLLASFFRYDANAGTLHWRKVPHPRFAVGDKVGTVSKDGYVRVMFQRRRWSAHRIIWCLETGGDVPNGMVIDHKNGDRQDNRWCNLRLATLSQNGANSKPRRDHLPKGVYTHKRKGVVVGYRAFIGQGGGSPRYLGLYPTIDQAAGAYRSAAVRQFGEFARFEV